MQPAGHTQFYTTLTDATPVNTLVGDTTSEQEM